jgi:hypothetical protein
MAGGPRVGERIQIGGRWFEKVSAVAWSDKGTPRVDLRSTGKQEEDWEEAGQALMLVAQGSCEPINVARRLCA